MIVGDDVHDQEYVLQEPHETSPGSLTKKSNSLLHNALTTATQSTFVQNTLKSFGKFYSVQCSFSISVQKIDILAVMNDEKNDFGFNGNQKTHGNRLQLKNFYIKYQVYEMK